MDDLELYPIPFFDFLSINRFIESWRNFGTYGDIRRRVGSLPDRGKFAEKDVAD
jgi:hypothetical protein